MAPLSQKRQPDSTYVCNTVEIIKPTLKACVGCLMNVGEEPIVFKAAYVYEA